MQSALPRDTSTWFSTQARPIFGCTAQQSAYPAEQHDTIPLHQLRRRFQFGAKITPHQPLLCVVGLWSMEGVASRRRWAPTTLSSAISFFLLTSLVGCMKCGGTLAVSRCPRACECVIETLRARTRTADAEGIIGLAFSELLSDKSSPSLLDSMLQAGEIVSAEFAVYLSSTRVSPFESEITFGHVKPHLHTGPFTYHDLTDEKNYWALKMLDFQIAGTSIFPPGSGTCTNSTLGYCQLVVDTGTSFLTGAGCCHKGPLKGCKSPRAAHISAVLLITYEQCHSHD